MQQSLSPAVKGALAIVACAFLWSTAGLFIKLIDWNPFWIAGIRSLIAGVFLLAIVRTVRLNWSWPLVGAAVAYAACMILFVLANKLTTSANAILIQYWAPVGTAILGVLVLKEKLRPEQLVALVATLAGLILLFAGKLAPGDVLGNLAALGSGLAFALMFLFTRMQKDGTPLQSLMLSHFLTAVVALSLAAFQEPPRFSATSLGAILALGVGQIGLAAVFFAYGIKRVSALTANLLAVIEPVFNPLWVFLLLGETPSGWTLAGGGLIVASVTAASVVAARRESWEKLRREKSLLRTMLESASEAIYAKDRDGKIVVINETGARLIGYRREDLLGRSHDELEPTGRARAFRATDEEVMVSGIPAKQEYQLEIDGQLRWIESHKSPWRDEAGRVIGVIGVSNDVTDRKETEERVRRLLNEKDVILREVHHRIKNHMGTVIGLLTLQAEASGNPVVVRSLEEAKGRVYSMMSLYDKLYQAKGSYSLSIRDYLSPLVDEILTNFPRAVPIRVQKEFSEAVIDVNKVQSLGIMVNELITNCMKYAFGPQTAGSMAVSVTMEEGRGTLVVWDDGVGMPLTPESQGFGLSLIQLLTESLRGRLTVEESHPGTRVTIEFKA